jgi:hypothetical protein
MGYKEIELNATPRIKERRSLKKDKKGQGFN